jgi:hypothetical protein
MEDMLISFLLILVAVKALAVIMGAALFITQVLSLNRTLWPRTHLTTTTTRQSSLGTLPPHTLPFLTPPTPPFVTPHILPFLTPHTLPSLTLAPPHPSLEATLLEEAEVREKGVKVGKATMIFQNIHLLPPLHIPNSLVFLVSLGVGVVTQQGLVEWVWSAVQWVWSVAERVWRVASRTLRPLAGPETGSMRIRKRPTSI